MSLSTLLTERVNERTTNGAFRPLLTPLAGHIIAFVADAQDGTSAETVTLTTDGETLRIIASTPPQVTVTGTLESWRRVLSGELVWPHATNATLGVLTVTGDPIAHSWAIPALTALCLPTPAASRDELMSRTITNVAERAGITGRYVTVDGVQAYYETVGDGPALLVLHTAGRDGRQWHPAMHELASTHKIYATDLPGHGKSWPRPGAEPCLTNITEIAEWLLTFMSAVGENEFLVAGTSVGGNLSLLLPAISHRVRGVVAFQGADYTPTISEKALQLMQDPRVALSFSSRDQALTLIGPKAVPEAATVIAWSIEELSAPAQRGDLTAYSHTDTRNLMAEVRCPVTLVHGEADWLATREMVEATGARLVNADVRFVSLPGIGHYPHVEDPAQAAELIRELTATVEAAGR